MLQQLRYHITYVLCNANGLLFYLLRQYASSLFMHAYVAFEFDAVLFMKGYFIMPGVLKPTLDAMVEWDTDYKSSLKDL